MDNLKIEYKENSTENIFKTPLRRNTVRRNCSTIKNNNLKAKPLLREASVKLESEKTVLKDLDDLTEIFKIKASLRSIANDYFNNYNCGKKALKASNKTMSNLGSNRLTAEQASKMLGQLDSSFYVPDIARRIEKMKYDIFPRVIIQLRAGYNILLFGFGSKKTLLEDFHQRYLSSENSLIVTGYCAEVNIQAVLSRIVETYMSDVRIMSRSTQGMAEAVRDHFNDAIDPLYIVVHNIDGLSLRNAAYVFTILMQSTGIRIIATVDHVHSSSMWTHNKSDWLWHNCTTMACYQSETRVDNARLMSDKAHRGMASLLAVVDSLNDQAKTVFVHLAKFQLAHRGQSLDGMLLDNLYGICKDNLLVSSELALRTHLTEFRDHKLVTIKQGLDRADYVRIALDSASIKDFVDSYEAGLP